MNKIITSTGTVSIGIPTWNRSKMLMRAVRSALAQSYNNLEVIVSDNASNDDTIQELAQIEDDRLIVLKQYTNVGMVANFNNCLRAASGELFLMLSDDDYLEANAIQLLSQPFFKAQGIPGPSQIGMTWCPCAIISGEGQELWRTSGGPQCETPVELLTGLFQGERGPRFSSVMVRTADALAAGGYNEQRYGALCDTANWGAVALRYNKVICIDRTLVRYSNHSQSQTSRSKADQWRGWAGNMHADLCQIGKQQCASGNDRLESSARSLLTSITLTVLIQAFGTHTTGAALWSEMWRSRDYLRNLGVLRRLSGDGVKIFRLAELWIASFFERLRILLFAHVPPKQLRRYLGVGIWNTVFGYCSFAAFVALLTPIVSHGYVIASIISSLVNITVSFIGYKLFVFQTRGRYLQEWSRCVVVYSGGIAIGAMALPLVVETLRHAVGLRSSAPYVGGAILTCLGILYNFVGHKRFSFQA